MARYVGIIRHIIGGEAKHTTRRTVETNTKCVAESVFMDIVDKFNADSHAIESNHFMELEKVQAHSWA